MNEEIKIRSILGQTAQKIYKTTGKRVKLEYTVLSNPEGMLQKIFDECCNIYGMHPKDVIVESRKIDVAARKQAITFVLKDKIPSIHWVKIANILGYEDHSCAIHNYNTALQRIETDDEVFMKYYLPLYKHFYEN